MGDNEEGEIYRSTVIPERKGVRKGLHLQHMSPLRVTLNGPRDWAWSCGSNDAWESVAVRLLLSRGLRCGAAESNIKCSHLGETLFPWVSTWSPRRCS